MKISGRTLSKTIYEDLKKKVTLLQSKGITPQLIIVKSKNLDAVNNYINQKIKHGTATGIKVKVIEIYDQAADKQTVIKKTQKYIDSDKVHGLIFQKPSHANIDEELELLVEPEKDVDGFLSNSKHKAPIYRGVLRALQEAFSVSANENITEKELYAVLQTKNIVVIGKGKTGGSPVFNGFVKDGINPNNIKVIDSKTDNEKKELLIKGADIIISAVGKANPVDYHLFPKNAILIDLGIHFDEHNKIHGDFNEADIKDRVTFYTTTPGGIGPLTVAYLMSNVVSTALKKVS